MSNYITLRYPIIYTAMSYSETSIKFFSLVMIGLSKSYS